MRGKKMQKVRFFYIDFNQVVNFNRGGGGFFFVYFYKSLAKVYF